MRRDTKIVAAIVAAIPLVIVGASLACTWAIAHGASMQWRVAFRLLCHGIPHRCLTVWGVPMPICARCTAIYAGLFASVAAFAVTHLREKLARVLLFAAAAAMALDGFTQLAHLRESTNPLRIATGLAVGMAFGMWALASVDEARGSDAGREFTGS